MSDEKKSNKANLKKIMEDKKRLREEEKAIRDEMNANKEERKLARKQVTRSKNEVFEKRQALTESVRTINKAMLTKSIKNNLGDFKIAMDKFRNASAAFIEAGDMHIAAIEELSKYD